MAGVASVLTHRVLDVIIVIQGFALVYRLLEWPGALVSLQTDTVKTFQFISHHFTGLLVLYYDFYSASVYN